MDKSGSTLKRRGSKDLSDVASAAGRLEMGEEIQELRFGCGDKEVGTTHAGLFDPGFA